MVGFTPPYSNLFAIQIINLNQRIPSFLDNTPSLQPHETMSKANLSRISHAHASLDYNEYNDSVA
jgi:hypothetical protein